MEVRKILGFTWNTWRLKEEYAQMDGEHGEKDDQETNRKQNWTFPKLTTLKHWNEPRNKKPLHDRVFGTKARRRSDKQKGSEQQRWEKRKMMWEKNRFGTAIKAQNPPDKEFRWLNFAKAIKMQKNCGSLQLKQKNGFKDLKISWDSFWWCGWYVFPQ